MSVRQYIGARYVTKIYENSLDPSSAEWEGGRAYEPLTLVTYLNSSYLSKKEVPASVGNPASNPTYWVITGAYNGQIATLQNQIDDINAVIADIIQPKTIVISDSYGTSYPDPDTYPTMFTYMRQYSGLDADHLKGYAYSGSGFVHNNGSGTFLTRFTSDAASITDKDAISTILVAAGRNDWDASAPDLRAAIQSFGTYCRTNFPNAKLLLAFVGNGTNDAAYGTRAQQIGVFEVFRYADMLNFDGYLSGSEAILKNTLYMAADGMHPNDSGKRALAFYLLQGLNTGYVNVSYGVHTGNITPETGYSMTNGCQSFDTWTYDNETFLKGNKDYGAINVSYGTMNFTGSGVLSFKIGTINDYYVSHPAKKIYMPHSGIVEICAWVDSVTPDTSYKLWPCTIYVNADNEVILQTVKVASEANFYVHDIQFRNITQVSNPSVYD